MRHNKNVISRIVFFTIIYISYYKLFYMFNRSDNLAFYVMLVFMALAYYLTGFLDFDSKRNIGKDLIFVSMINILLGGINFIFTRSKKEMTVYIIVAMVSLILKWILASLNRNRVNVISVGEKEIGKRIKETLINYENYVYVGKYKENENLDLEEFVKERKVELIIIPDNDILKKYKKELLKLKLEGIKIRTYWQFLEEVEGKIDVSKIDEKWILNSVGFDILYNNLQRRVKRLFDLTVAIIISIPAILLMGITIVMMKIIAFFDSKERGPIFFSQERIGLGDKSFKMYKLRSMITKEHWAEVGFDPNKESWTTVGDPRITRLGKFLRKTRLDELPQLLNVFRGEMSFVGPRPESVSYVKELEKELPFYNLRHGVQPGLTGWAQVMYPYGATVEDSLRKLEFDLYYIKHQSFVMDIGIFFKTVKTVLFGKGR